MIKRATRNRSRPGAGGRNSSQEKTICVLDRRLAPRSTAALRSRLTRTAASTGNTVEVEAVDDGDPFDDDGDGVVGGTVGSVLPEGFVDAGDAPAEDATSTPEAPKPTVSRPTAMAAIAASRVRPSDISLATAPNKHRESPAVATAAQTPYCCCTCATAAAAPTRAAEAAPAFAAAVSQAGKAGRTG